MGKSWQPATFRTNGDADSVRRAQTNLNDKSPVKADGLVVENQGCINEGF